MFSISSYYAGRVFKEFLEILNNLIILSQRKKQFFVLFLLSLFVISLEGYSLSIVFEASNLIVNNEFLLSNNFLVLFTNWLNIPPNLLGIYSIVGLFFFIVCKNIFIIFVIFYKNNLLTDIQKTISYNMINNFLNQKYTFFINKHSSELISNIQQDVGLLMRNYVSVMHLLIELTLIFSMLVYLLILNFKAGSIFLISVLAYFIFYTFFTKKKILNLSHDRSILNQQILKNLQETFGNFREFIIYNCKQFFFSQLNIKFDIFFSNLKLTNILQQISKVLIEQVFLVIIILILIFGSFFNEQNLLVKIIPLLSVYFFTFLKILPSLNVIIIETQSYIYTKLFVSKIKSQLLSKKIDNFYKSKKKIQLKKSIKVNNVSYKFNNKYIFKNINFEIKKNEKIGVIGKSGSGKTTLLNIIMGFVDPSSGQVLIDNVKVNKSWQNNFAYVSQSVYLMDDNLRKNITLENNNHKINDKLFNDSVSKAGLDNFLKLYSERPNDSIGERGSKISGGELLRVGLARAYYSQRNVFILDEFTSALDSNTEKDILNNLNKIDKTIIIVSHRKSTLKYCDRVFELKNHQLKQL
jgi:ABC-type multidrug transport system fused ATPase/permease subunit